MPKRHFDIVIEDLSEPYVNEVAELHTRSFPESLAAALGASSIAADLRRRCLGPRKEFGCRIAVLESNRGVAGYYLCSKIEADGQAVGLLNRTAAAREMTKRIWYRPSLWRYLVGWMRRKVSSTRSIEDYPSGSTMVLTDICVHPASRGSNVAGELMADLEEQVAKRGCRRICLLVRTDNVRARKLYESFGWVRSAPESGRYSLVSMYKDFVLPVSGL